MTTAQQKYNASPKGKIALEKAQANYLAKPENRERMRASSQRRQTERQEYVRAIAKAAGCTDCGTLEVLHFHHLDPSTKAFSVSQVGTRSYKSIDAEIAKCIVVCHPCHKARHQAMKVAACTPKDQSEAQPFHP